VAFESQVVWQALVVQALRQVMSPPQLVIVAAATQLLQVDVSQVSLLAAQSNPPQSVSTQVLVVVWQEQGEPLQVWPDPQVDPLQLLVVQLMAGVWQEQGEPLQVWPEPQVDPLQLLVLQVICGVTQALFVQVWPLWQLLLPRHCTH
jgi:hypothetical protein